MKKIIGIGNSLVDVLVRLSNDSTLFNIGLKKGAMQLVDSDFPLAALDNSMAFDGNSPDITGSTVNIVRAPGGSAANTMKALAHEGVEVAFIGKVADDDNGHFFVDALMGEGVNTDSVAIVGNNNSATQQNGTSAGQNGATTQLLRTGTATTFVSPDGERTFATCLGVSGTLEPADIKPEALDGYDILYVEGYLVQNHALIERAMQEANSRGMQVALDLASYNVVEQEREFFAYLVEEYVDILFANPEEATAFTGLPPRESVANLADEVALAVVKLGSDGAVAQMGDELVFRPARKVDHVVDTTGAGDFFAAGFLASYVKGQDLAHCLDNGATLAAKVIQVMGTTIKY